MKLWKYNSLLLILSITIVFCSTTDRLTKSNKKADKKVLKNIDKQYENLDQAVGKELELKKNKKEAVIKKNVVSSTSDISTAKSFSEVSSKSLSKTETKAPKKYTLKIVPNDLFKHTDKQIIKELTRNEPGKIKQGIVNFVIDTDEKKNVLIANPVNLRITVRKIEIFTTENENSLYYHSTLDDVSKITQTYKGTNCFDVVINRDNKKVASLIEKDRLVLCGIDYRDWISSINELKRESVKILPNNDVKYVTKQGMKDILNIHKNSKIVADFNKVNRVVKNKSRPLSISQSYKLSNNEEISDDLIGLYYDNTCNAIIESPINDSEDKQMTNEISKIYEVLSKGHIAQQQANRKFKDKLDAVRKESKLLQKKKEMMERAIQEKELQEKERFELLNNSKKSLEEVQLLKAVTQKLRSLKQGEIIKSKKIIQREIKLEKEKANLNAQAVMNLVDKREKLLDFSKCNSIRILSFTDTTYIKETCVGLFGLANGEICQKRENFCEMCCDFHIGFKHLDERVECKDKCTALTEGRNPKYLKKYKNKKLD